MWGTPIVAMVTPPSLPATHTHTHIYTEIHHCHLPFNFYLECHILPMSHKYTLLQCRVNTLEKSLPFSNSWNLRISELQCRWIQLHLGAKRCYLCTHPSPETAGRYQRCLSNRASLQSRCTSIIKLGGANSYKKYFFAFPLFDHMTLLIKILNLFKIIIIFFYSDHT